LFNRCVLNWFGDWSAHAYYEVGREFTLRIDLERAGFVPNESLMERHQGKGHVGHREAVVDVIVQIHDTLHAVNTRLVKKGARTAAITP